MSVYISEIRLKMTMRCLSFGFVDLVIALACLSGRKWMLPI